MAYQICIVKRSACCAMPFQCCNLSGGSVCTTVPQCMRSLEIYGCTPNLTQGEFNDRCVQGVYVPSGSCCAWTVPAGVCSITVELWGAGAGGGSGSSTVITNPSRGGGGGTYVKRTIPVLPDDLITLCAGAGGVMGQSGGSSNNYVGWSCATPQGSCSYVKRNGNFCIDAGGGSAATFTTPLASPGCGTSTITGDSGLAYGQTNYSVDLRAKPTVTFANCSSNLVNNQHNSSGGTAFGGDRTMWGTVLNCGQYLKWNTTCRNSDGVYGPGGGSCSNSTAYNVGMNYSCSTNASNLLCERGKAAPPGNFPGGGGGGGTATCCTGLATAGGNGAPGYIRVYY